MSLNEECSYVTNCHCCCPHHGTKHSINNIFLHNTARHQHKQKPFFHDISERSYKYFLHLCPCTSLSPGSKTPARQHFLKQSLCGFVAADTTSTTSEITSHQPDSRDTSHQKNISPDKNIFSARVQASCCY